MRWRRHGRRVRRKLEPDDWLYRDAICGYVVAEKRDGVTRAELRELRLSGRSPERERKAVDRAVDELVQANLLRIDGDKLFLAASIPGEPETAIDHRDR